MVSIIIPTLNEEDYLEKLLSSIKEQDFLDYEIIVSDAGSTDQTLNIAKTFGCSITHGGLPAYGRNEGAKIAKGDILFFLDADTVLPKKSLKNAIREIKKRKLDLASFCLVPMPKNKVSLFLIKIFYNQPIVLLENALPHAATGIIVRKDMFEKAGGFDEDVKLAEDHYLARRAQRLFNAKCGILRSTEIFVSDRRFRKDGWVRVGIKYLLCELHMIFIGPVRSNIFNYKFNHYKDEAKD